MAVAMPKTISSMMCSPDESFPGARRLEFLRSAGARDGMIMAASMIAAGGLDYSASVVAGRWLDPVDFGVFVSVTAMLQVLILLSIAIRMVVAIRTAELAAHDMRRVGAFVRRVWRWSWKWGVVATAAVALACPLLAPMFQLSDTWPLWAGSLLVLPLLAREALFGSLQGIQAFTVLGLAQLVPAFLRVILIIGLILAGGRAVGAILAQPLAYVVGAGLVFWWLCSQLRESGQACDPAVSWSSSLTTVAGLAVFALMTNLDALFVKVFYSPEAAGGYGPVVTLARISLFLPWAIGLVLLPKVAQRKAKGRDARPILMLALAAALTPGLVITVLYFLFSGALVSLIFTKAYADPGVILGLSSLAATFNGGINIWLNYALSLKRHSYIAILAGILILQAVGMYLTGRDDLVHMTLVMALAGLLGNLVGLARFWRPEFETIPGVAGGQRLGAAVAQEGAEIRVLGRSTADRGALGRTGHLA
jgi:O-antigen/teichoic acid export membrane protein